MVAGGSGPEGEDCAFQAVVLSEAEAEQFNTAVFRFLELNTRLDDERTVLVVSSPGQGVRRQSVTFWSPAAADDFARFWMRYKAEVQTRRPMPAFAR